LLLFLYNLFIALYGAAVRFASLWNQKARKWIDGRKNIFQRIAEELPPGKQVIWMHAASLGEFEQGRSLLEKLRQEYPQYPTVLTFFSPSGYEAVKHDRVADHVFYLPEATASNARRFIKQINPVIVLWIKYDYWYHYLASLKKLNVQVLLISAIFRKGQPFFKFYGGLHKKMLGCFSALFVQNTESVKLLQAIGIQNNVVVTGDTRFDRVIEIASNPKTLPLIQQFCGEAKVIVAGSTWPEDEEELDHYVNTHQETRLIIAPHEIDEDHVSTIETLFHHSIRYSKLQEMEREGKQANPALNTLIIDNIGMLSQLYRFATIAYVGGGFGKDGVHNVLEAAVYGKPVIFGPVYDKFQEAVELIDEDAAYSIESALELEAIIDKLLLHPALYTHSCAAAKNYVYSKKGATELVLDYIKRLKEFLVLSS
jgi:3-deoxy-D-manno-octulosonic-acid transferase